MKWIVFKIIIASIILFSAVEFVLWRNVLPEYIFSVYSEKKHIGNMDIIVFINKDPVATWHGYPYYFNVWVKSNSSFFYKQSYNGYIDRFFEVDINDILPRYDFNSKGRSVKFVSINDIPIRWEQRNIHTLIQNQDNEIIALDIAEDVQASPRKKNICHFWFPEIGNWWQISLEHQKEWDDLTQKTINDSLLIEEIKQVVGWYSTESLECLDSLFQKH